MRFIKSEHIKSLFFINFCAFITFLILSNNYALGNNFSIEKDLSDAEKYYMTAQKYFSNTEEYDSAVVNYTHAASLFLKLEDWKGLIMCNLKLTECFNIKGEFQLALDNANRAMQIADLHLSQDELLFSDIYYLLGKTEYELGNYNESISRLKKGLQYIDHSKTEYDSIKVLVFKTLGNNYLRLGKLNIALKSYNDALYIEFDRNGDSTLSVAVLYANIGIVYSAKGYYFEAEKYIRNSIRITEQLLPVTDPELARGYVNLGRLLVIIGNTNDALNYFNKAEEIYIEKFGPDYYKLALVYFNKGGIFILKNDFQKALTYHEKALEIYSKYLKPSNAVFGKLYGNFG
nr:tetratricopeptide repeat protein [Bacteroidota bacterium]